MNRKATIKINYKFPKTINSIAKTAIELDNIYKSIDPMLQDIISILWKYNVITRYSCQGHIETNETIEDGYIYMDFSIEAFNAFSKTMFEVDKYLNTTFPIKDENSGDRIWYHPYLQIERSVRKVDDDFSNDELNVRFRFHPLNVISRKEFYKIVEDKLLLSFN
jgi:hypothetical protein